jgi:hypothetical protein
LIDFEDLNLARYLESLLGKLSIFGQKTEHDFGFEKAGHTKTSGNFPRKKIEKAGN